MRISRVRRTVGIILTALVVVFTVYLSAVMIHRIRTVVLKSGYVGVFVLELIICVVAFIVATDIRTGFLVKGRTKALRAAGWIVRSVSAAFIVIILLMTCKVLTGCLIDNAGDGGNAVVLGMALEDGMPSDDLILRVGTAHEYIVEHPSSVLILTGGNPDDQGRTEAAVMKELLMERGVSEDKMILEDRASNTEENFQRAADLMSGDNGQPCVIITSNYHMDRAVRTAKSAGLANVLRKPAPSSFISFGANVMREVVLEIMSIIPR